MSDSYLLNKSILVVDDEVEIVNMIVSFLKEYGFTDIRSAASVSDALFKSENSLPDIALLDVMLPDGNGFDLMKSLRKMGDFPIIFLTAKGEDDDRLKGFGLGADDYIVKPFLAEELIFRILAVLRRTYKNENEIVKLLNSQIDFSKAEVIKDGVSVALTAKEFEILSVLYRNAGRIVTIDRLLEACWGYESYGYENSLMAHIRRIREKIEANPSKPESLVTAKGLGYRLNVEKD